MMMNALDRSMYFNEQALKLRSHRQQLIASNIANADTPHYKARDIDFSSSLKEALAGRGGPVELARTSGRHLPGTGAAPARTLYRGEVQPSVDGNTVDMDVERAHFAENTMHIEAVTQFISGRFKNMMTAIRGE